MERRGLALICASSGGDNRVAEIGRDWAERDEFVAFLHPNTRQRIHSRRLELRGQRIQHLKENQDVGHLARPNIDRAEPFSLPFDLQITSRQFSLGDLRDRDGSSLPCDSHHRKSEATELDGLASLYSTFHVLYHRRQESAKNDADGLVGILVIRCHLEFLAILANQFERKMRSRRLFAQHCDQSTDQSEMCVHINGKHLIAGLNDLAPSQFLLAEC